jgi:hypothetical protein
MLLKVVRSGKLQPSKARNSSLRDERNHEGVRHVWKRGKRGRTQGGSHEWRALLIHLRLRLCDQYRNVFLSVQKYFSLATNI